MIGLSWQNPCRASHSCTTHKIPSVTTPLCVCVCVCVCVCARACVDTTPEVIVASHDWTQLAKSLQSITFMHNSQDPCSSHTHVCVCVYVACMDTTEVVAASHDWTRLDKYLQSITTHKIPAVATPIRHTLQGLPSSCHWTRTSLALVTSTPRHNSQHLCTRTQITWLQGKIKFNILKICP